VKLRLATRGSALALAQSTWVQGELQRLHPGLEVEIQILKSEGDQRSDIPLRSAGGQGLFTKALEDALQRGEADLAVHSLKDLPTQLAPGLSLAAISEREDWREAWVSAKTASPWDLPQGAVVGTGSLRRRAQLALKRPDLRYAELRGNVDTRLRKIAEGEVDGGLLALAGLKRLGLQDKARMVLSGEELLPAPGQGFLAIETKDRSDALRLCRYLNVPRAEAESQAERALLARLEAGCHAPVGALAVTEGEELYLKAFVGLDEKKPVRTEKRGPAKDPVALGWALADEVLKGR
jgi:hydroxymethylbilane synthase